MLLAEVLWGPIPEFKLELEESFFLITPRGEYGVLGVEGVGGEVGKVPIARRSSLDDC